MGHETAKRRARHSWSCVLSPCCARSHTANSPHKACRTTVKDATIHAPTCILPARMASISSAFSSRGQRNRLFETPSSAIGVKEKEHRGHNYDYFVIRSTLLLLLRFRSDTSWHRLWRGGAKGKKYCTREGPGQFTYYQITL